MASRSGKNQIKTQIHPMQQSFLNDLFSVYEILTKVDKGLLRLVILRSFMLKALNTRKKQTTDVQYHIGYILHIHSVI